MSSHGSAVEGEQGARLTGQARAEYVRSLFGRIVPQYDRFNSLSTFGQDRRWRRMVVDQAAVPPGGQVLDVATGTGAVAFALARRTPTARVVGLDFCLPMIERARQLGAERTGIARGVTSNPPSFVEGDILELPYPDSSFDAVTISFGLRNVADIPRALSEIHRVLRPGGRFVCLELTHPRSALVRIPFHLYFFKLSPLLGALLSGDRAAYTYLPHSLIRFPDVSTLADMFRQAGFTRVRHKRLNLGTIAIHGGVK
ncbi:MAG TPA: bifunctional demethylmenaquinone methyltransferase/2-methoxy-6-polyprenyl-1,4-benzoquinol methylase UbiE [Chloroflexota bacterium]|jgi:demethylmenaquinone methyltransferase/2-methoxy-6-polyprenyl-1,4-benzoquinol methylase